MEGTDTRTRGVTKKIASFLSRGLHSNSIMKEKGFCDLFNYTMPRYTILSGTLLRSVIPELYCTMNDIIKRNLKEAFKREVWLFSLTSDGWSYWDSSSFVSPTYPIVDDGFCLRVYSAACKLFPDAHTGDTLREVIQGVIAEHELQNRCTLAVRDNAQNFISAICHSN